MEGGVKSMGGGGCVNKKMSLKSAMYLRSYMRFAIKRIIYELDIKKLLQI